MNNTTLILIVAVVLLMVGLVWLAAPRCSTDGVQTVCERRTVLVPGFTLGVPTGEIGVETVTVAVRTVEITVLDGSDALAIAKRWLASQAPSANELVRLTVRGRSSGAFVLAFGHKLKDFSDAIAAQYGLRAPDEITTIGKYYCFVFFGKAER